jgi:hypothetical protein
MADRGRQRMEADDEREYVEFSARDLEAVVFGFRSNAGYREEIKQLVIERYPECRLREMRRAAARWPMKSSISSQTMECIPRSHRQVRLAFSICQQSVRPLVKGIASGSAMCSPCCSRQPDRSLALHLPAGG